MKGEGSPYSRPLLKLKIIPFAFVQKNSDLFILQEVLTLKTVTSAVFPCLISHHPGHLFVLVWKNV
jgi:hypothetical protein